MGAGEQCGPPQQADGPGPWQGFRVAWPAVTGGEEDLRKKRTGIKTKKSEENKACKKPRKKSFKEKGSCKGL